MPEILGPRAQGPTEWVHVGPHGALGPHGPHGALGPLGAGVYGPYGALGPLWQ